MKVMNYDYLKTSAEESLEDYRTLIGQKPDTALRCKADAHTALAAYYLASGENGFESEVQSLIDIELERLARFSSQLYPALQNKYIFLALSAHDLERAKAIAAASVSHNDSNLFEAAANLKLRALLGFHWGRDSIEYMPTDTEALLLTALNKLEVGELPDYSALEKFWSALKSKRYKNTVFEFKNLFVLALHFLASVGRNN